MPARVGAGIFLFRAALLFADLNLGMELKKREKEREKERKG
jgi:hypothetical protein